MRRNLISLAATATLGAMLLSALAGAAPPTKKKKKPKKHTAPTPAASATPEATTPAPAPATTPEPTPSPEPSPEPTPSTTPSESEPAPAAEDAGAKPEQPPWSVAGTIGWGYNVGAKFGFGVRGGYTLPFHVYIGGTFVFHVGENLPGGAANFFYPGVEGGYDLVLGPILLRPYVGVGPIFLHAPTSQTTFGFWPGLTAAYLFTPAFFAGADFHQVIGTYSLTELFGDVGVRF